MMLGRAPGRRSIAGARRPARGSGVARARRYAAGHRLRRQPCRCPRRAHAASHRRPSTSPGWPSRSPTSGIVARNTPELDPAALDGVDAAARAGRSSTRTAPGHRPRRPARRRARCRPSRCGRCCREFVYAASHLPRWIVRPRRGAAALTRRGDADMKPDVFLADLHRKPDVAAQAGRAAAQSGTHGPTSSRTSTAWCCSGMGSSALRRRGRRRAAPARGRSPAVSELAARLLAQWGPGTLVVATRRPAARPRPSSARGCASRRECAVRRADQTAGSPITERCGDVVDHRAPGYEGGGVACRSFQHTLALLLALEPPDRRTSPRASSTRVAEASSTSWRPVATGSPSCSDR